MIIRHAKNTFDASWIANANLNVGLLEETRFWVNPVTFDKYAFHGVERRQVARRLNLVKVVYYRAIQFPKQEVVASFVGRRRNLCALTVVEKVSMHCPNRLDSHRGCEIKAKPQFDGGSDDERFFDLIGKVMLASPALEESGEFKATAGIGFPEVDSGPKPIVVVLADPEFFAGNQTFSDLSVAAVISQNERAGESVHSAGGLVGRGQFAALSEQAFLFQELPSLLRRIGVFGADTLHGLEEFFIFLLAHARPARRTPTGMRRCASIDIGYSRIIVKARSVAPKRQPRPKLTDAKNRKRPNRGGEISARSKTHAHSRE